VAVVRVLIAKIMGGRPSDQWEVSWLSIHFPEKERQKNKESLKFLNEKRSLMNRVSLSLIHQSQLSEQYPQPKKIRHELKGISRKNQVLT
jgi:hypothetical protein